MQFQPFNAEQKKRYAAMKWHDRQKHLVCELLAKHPTMSRAEAYRHALNQMKAEAEAHRPLKRVPKWKRKRARWQGIMASRVEAQDRAKNGMEANETHYPSSLDGFRA